MPPALSNHRGWLPGSFFNSLNRYQAETNQQRSAKQGAVLIRWMLRALKLQHGSGRAGQHQIAKRSVERIKGTLTRAMAGIQAR